MPDKKAGHFYCLAHLLAELCAAENMVVQVLYRLASIGTAVCDHTVTAAESLAFGDLGDRLKDLSNVYGVFLVYLISGCNMNLGHDENMYGSLRIYIAESVHVFVFINLGGGDVTSDDLTEQAIHCSELVDPPNAALEEDAEKVDKPHEGNTNEDKYDCENNSNHILLLKAAAKTVNYPNDCDCRDAENKLDYLRKIVNCFDERFHFIYLFHF